MENRTNNNVGIFLFIIIFGVTFIDVLGFIGMIIAFVLMTSYVDNFVLKPLSKKLSVKHYTPSNYMYRKLKNIREVVWIISAILGIPLIFIVEVIAIAISVAKINELKRELGIPITSFSKQDYLIYEEYSKFSEYDEYNGYETEENDVKEYTVKKNDLFNTSVINKKIETVVEPENLEDKEKLLRKEIEVLKAEIKKNIPDDIFFKKNEKFDFDKPVEEMSKVEPIKTSTSSIWDEPIGNNANIFNTNETDKIEPVGDEIRCEKCGTIMSKMKIACPKCGTLVKNSYRSGK